MNVLKNFLKKIWVQATVCNQNYFGSWVTTQERIVLKENYFSPYFCGYYMREISKQERLMMARVRFSFYIGSLSRKSQCTEIFPKYFVNFPFMLQRSFSKKVTKSLALLKVDSWTSFKFLKPCERSLWWKA